MPPTTHPWGCFRTPSVWQSYCCLLKCSLGSDTFHISPSNTSCCAILSLRKITCDFVAIPLNQLRTPMNQWDYYVASLLIMTNKITACKVRLYAPDYSNSISKILFIYRRSRNKRFRICGIIWNKWKNTSLYCCGSKIIMFYRNII